MGVICPVSLPKHRFFFIFFPGSRTIQHFLRFWDIKKLSELPLGAVLLCFALLFLCVGQGKHQQIFSCQEQEGGWLLVQQLELLHTKELPLLLCSSSHAVNIYANACPCATGPPVVQNKISCNVQNPAQAHAAGIGGGDTTMSNECRLSNNQGTSSLKCVCETLPLCSGKLYSLFVPNAYGCGSAKDLKQERSSLLNP